MQDTAPAVSSRDRKQENSIIDQFGRIFDYLRISVIEHCNLRCVYCMPEEGVNFVPRTELLTTDEIQRILKVLSKIGLRKVRFTGGEPLLRNDIVEIIKCAVKIDNIKSVHMTTNGILLGQMAEDLRLSGLYGLNVSLDTLDKDKFFKISRRQGIERVWDGFRKAIDLGFPSIKVNTVIMKGFNDTEIEQFAELTKNDRITVRLIELMPFDAHQIWKTGHFYGAELILKKLNKLYPEMEVVKGSSTEHHIFQIKNYKGKLAVIPSFTRSLCTACSRIRLTANGRIRNCLYSEEEHNLLKFIRDGASDEDIARIFKEAMWIKSVDGWEAQKRAKKDTSHIHRNSMTQIGG
jgi:cyclic pyranopterin phosphate synthase